MHPYENLPPEAFWRSAIATKNPLNITGLWQPKFTFKPEDNVVTVGSCFAQHIGKAMVRRGYNWLDAEPAPAKTDPELKKKFNYGIFSFRTGNIYTTELLLQWCQWAFGEVKVPNEVWTNPEGRFIDPMRPNIEPNGFANLDEMEMSREATLEAIRRGVKKAKVFVFTLGLTEAWRNIEHGYFYPMCPGTLHGDFSSEKHEFINLRYPQIKQPLMQAIRLLRSVNPDLKFILTVSPVPLTATASGKHVLTATTHSKSLLRAVAGDIADEQADVDYFPSYEIITGFPFRGMFFEPNMRSVSDKGVEFVMASFFEALEKGRNKRPKPASAKKSNLKETSFEKSDEVVCEEELLDAFS